MTDPNELTRFDRIILEAGVTCMYLESWGNGNISAAGVLAAETAFQIIELARLRSEAVTALRTLERWAAMKSGQL